MNEVYNLLLPLLWGVSVAGILWCCVQAGMSMTYVTLADGQRSERRLPIMIRLLLPLTPNLVHFFQKPSFAKHRDRASRRLVSSGLEEVMTPSDFLALQALVPIVLTPIMIGLLWLGLAEIPGKIGVFLHSKMLLLNVLALALACAYTSSWLQTELKKRHGSIQRSLPFVLDLMTLSVEAGMDFMSALQRIVEKRRVDPLCEELIRVLREIQLGKTRKQALLSMATRIDNPDIISVANALVQADEMGASVGKTLRIQADQMRMRRFQRAEKMAYEAPIKMLFPLIAFIFPAVFLILLGPIFYQMAQSLF